MIITKPESPEGVTYIDLEDNEIARTKCSHLQWNDCYAYIDKEVYLHHSLGQSHLSTKLDTYSLYVNSDGEIIISTSNKELLLPVIKVKYEEKK